MRSLKLVSSKESLSNLSEIALFSSLILVLSIVADFIPIIGLFASLLIPVPFTIAFYRYKLREWISIFLITFFGSLIISGPLKAISLIIGPGIIGLFIGLGLRLYEREKRFSILIGLSTLGVLTSFLLVFFLSKLVLHQDIIKLTLESTAKSYKLSQDLYSSLGLKTNVPTPDPAIFFLLIPSMLVTTATIYGTLITWVTLKILEKTFKTSFQFLGISQWGLERWVTPLFFLTLLLAILAGGNENLKELSYILTPNLFILTVFIALVHTVAYWGKRYGPIAGTLALIIGLQAPILAIVFCAIDHILKLSRSERPTNG